MNEPLKDQHVTEEEILSRPDLVHWVSVSGGKDSTATYCMALDKLGPTGFRAIAADTGNEHPLTYEQVNNLHVWTGGPEVEWVKADFTARLERKRDYMLSHWCKPKGDAPAVPPERIERAVAALNERLAHPERANPYLDMCLWKGRFPSRKAQFCTEALKIEPIQAVQADLLRAGRIVISWQGVRASESFERSQLPKIQRLNEETICGAPVPGQMWTYRPLLEVESVDEVFAIAARHGVPRNPLYDWGLKRVGCFPCVNCAKAELALVDRQAPDQIDRLEDWEERVSVVSRRQDQATFFPIANDPVLASEIAYQAALGKTLKITAKEHGVRRMVEWAKSAKGGRQKTLFDDPPPSKACNEWGMCE